MTPRDRALDALAAVIGCALIGAAFTAAGLAGPAMDAALADSAAALIGQEIR